MPPSERGTGGDQAVLIWEAPSQGHRYARFRRALATGNPPMAEAPARDVHRLSLADTLDLCLLYQAEPAKYERAGRTVDCPADRRAAGWLI